MRHYLIPVVILLASSIALANGVTSRAGKFTVALSSQPSPPIVGENMLIMTVKDGDKPLSGAGVAVHIDMTSMPMPADAQATPGKAAGEYGASLNFSMAGTWKVDVAVQQMAGMKMDGDGTAHFIVETGKGITAKGSGPAIPLNSLFMALLLIAVVVPIAFRRRIPSQSRGYIAGILTLVIVFFLTYTVVHKYRNTKQATVIGSATMDMDPSSAAPGTTAVTTEVVHAMPFQASATYTGTVVPEQEEDIFPRVTGRLLYMPFYPGDRIAAGQVVAKLDTEELAAKEAQAAYGNLGATQGVSAANADIATARAEQLKAQKMVDQAQAQLAQVQSAARSVEDAVKAAQSEHNSAQQMATEADSAASAVQAGIDQANAAVLQAQSDVESAQADVAYWGTEIEREKKLYAQGAIAKKELDRETAQAAAAHAKLNQMKAAVLNAEAGITRAKQEYAQAQARQAAAQSAIATAAARVEQAQAERDAATGKIAEARAAVQTAQADVRAAEAGVTGASAKAGVATAAALQAKAALSEAGTIRGYTVIRASAGGIVTARNIAPGVLVQPGMSILKIAKVDVARIQVNVSEADLAQIQPGQLLIAHTIDAPNRPITARVSDIFPAHDATARTAIVEARVPNPGYLLKPGEYLSVEVTLGNARQRTITVPTGALIVRSGESSLYVAVSDGLRTVARRRMVTTGRVSNDRTEILSGLRDGDEVITSGLADLHDGDAVTAVQTADASPAAARD